jgi:hypothetical protein
MLRIARVSPKDKSFGGPEVRVFICVYAQVVPGGGIFNSGPLPDRTWDLSGQEHGMFFALIEYGLFKVCITKILESGNSGKLKPDFRMTDNKRLFS